MEKSLIKRSITLTVMAASLLSLVSCRFEAASIVNPSDADLGKKIFNDRRLSAEHDVSCASCHRSALHFSDGRAVSLGSGGKSGTRNSPSLLDSSRALAFFWDGRETSLEHVVLQPFTNPVEMGLADMNQLADRLASRPEYSELLLRQGGSLRVDKARLAAVISAYLGSLPAADGPGFRHLSGQAVLDDEALAGLALFNGKAECGICHVFTRGNSTLTDNQSHHTGIGFEQVAGRIAPAIAHLDEALATRTLGHAILSDRRISELGKYTSSRRVEDLGAFRTPSLRNVARTAPYMHDGSVPTLEEALEREIYYRNLSRGTPIQLTVEEKRALLAFLRSLSDTPPP
jgi:cytochrome c peroxidase